MFQRNDDNEPPSKGNGQALGMPQVPRISEFVITRKTDRDYHGTVVKAHTLGLGSAGCLLCYETVVVPDENGLPVLAQKVVRIFRHWLDVQEIEIPDQSVKH